MLDEKLSPLHQRVYKVHETPFKEKLEPEVVNAYRYPPVGAQHEKESFNIQSDKFNTVEPMSEELRSKVLDRAEHFYKYSKWSIPEDFLSDEHIVRVLVGVMRKNPKKNPGAILTRLGMSTNLDVLARLGIDGILDMVRARLTELLTSEDTRYAADPVRIFQKLEGHKMEKVLQRRWRLIWGVSLIDQIVDRLLYEPVVEVSLAACEKQSAKPGISFKHGGVDRMVRLHEDVGPKNWTSFDASSFDFTVSGDQLDVVRELNSRLCLTEGPLREKWEDLSKRREEALKYGTFVFSDGTMCRQVQPGIQKSGRFTTIDANCKVVVTNRIRYDIAKKLPSNPLGTVAMGDDAVEYDVGADYQQFIAENCGNRLTRECEPGPFASQSFCSMNFKRLPTGLYVSVPQNWAKNTWCLANMEGNGDSYEEALSSLVIEYRFHEKWGVLYEELKRVAPTRARSKEYYDSIHLRLESATNAGFVLPKTTREAVTDAETRRVIDISLRASQRNRPACARVWRSRHGAPT